MKPFLADSGAGRWQSYVWDMAALSGLALLIALALMHVLQPEWRDVYLYNGDSLTLALLEKSLRAGESFRWVLSSQLFLFPEGLLYALCSALATSVQASFLINSAVALVLLYGGYYLLGYVVRGSRQSGHAFALFSTGLIVLCMLCETRPGINGPTFVTLFLFNTYYYGAILCGLLVLYWVVCVLVQERDSVGLSRRGVGPLLAIFVVTALAYFSDPLFFLQCSAPLLAVLCLLYFTKHMSGRAVILLAVSQLAGLALGSAGRSLCKAYVGNPVIQYIDFRSIAKGIEFLSGIFYGVLHVPASLFEFGVIASGLLAAILAVILVLRHRGCPFAIARLPAAEALLTLFALSSPVASISGALLTGNAWTRYWLPLAFFPILALLSLRGRCINNGKSLVAVVACVVAAAVPYGFHLYKNIVQEPSSGLMSANVECYNYLMRHKPFNTVGGFWTTRSLDLYSDTSSRALQVTNELRPFAWMNNRALYSTMTFSGVIVDRLVGKEVMPNHIYPDDVRFLGSYTKKFDCPTFDIYYYDTDSEGFVLLNEHIKK